MSSAPDAAADGPVATAAPATYPGQKAADFVAEDFGFQRRGAGRVVVALISGGPSTSRQRSECRRARTSGS